jgi:putative N6-adenine-specific DNA methylase
MCGSGSFSIEAAMMSRRIPPGWFRRFAFMDWPAFRPRQWAYVQKAALSAVASPVGVTAAIIASDKDHGTCRGLSETLERVDLSGSVQVVNADFFHMPLDLTAVAPPHQAGLIVLNPPYGKRIGSHEESRRLLAAICDTLMTGFKGWRFALLALPQFLPPGLSRHCQTRAFHHGGLRLALYIGKV